MPTPDTISLVTSVLTALSVLVAAIAVVVSVRTAAAQAKLTAKLNTDQAALTLQLHREQLILSQRQLFLEIWPKLEQLDTIHLGNLIVPNVVKSVNVLELVALCWEGEMVDSSVIRRSFGRRYVELVETIRTVPNLKNPNKSGLDLLRENPAIGRLYDQLRQEMQEQGAILPVEKTRSG